MDALEIRMTFASPVTRPKMPIHFESALLYASIFAGVDEGEAKRLLDAAIAYQGDGALGVYCASAILFDPPHHFTRFATRRFDLHDFARDIRRGVVKAKESLKVDLGSGPIRGWLNDVPMMWTAGARAWLLCKDSDALATLLGRLRFIGKHSKLGSGQMDGVPDVRLSDEPEAWKRRILPFHVDGAQEIAATVRPPYYDRRNIQKAYLHPALISGEFGVFA